MMNNLTLIPTSKRRPGAMAWAPLLAALVLAGCATAPEPPRADIAVPAQYKEAAAPAQGAWKPAQPAEAQPRGAWWLAFNDPVLDQLQQQAQTANPSLAAAAARVRAARAALGGARADRLPQIGLNAGVARARQSPAELGVPENAAVRPGTVWNIGLGASYEVDLFQRVANSVNAAQADAQATEATYRSVLLALQADVAQTYFELRATDAELALLDRGVQLREETYKLTQRRQAAGDVSEFDVARSRTELATTRAEAQGVRGRRAQLEHALALLLGQPPSALNLAVSPLSLQATVPEVPAGLPSALLERRPDVAAAQAQLMAATARVGQARSALFPALSLTANGGHASYELRDLFNWSARSWLVNAVMSLPLFDGGRNRAGIERAEAALDEAVASYRQTVLQAFGDVEDSLSGLGTARSQVEALDDAVQAARRSAELADKRYRAGEDSYLTLIDTQRSLLAVERQAIQSRATGITSTIGLIRALGGDWGTAPRS